MKFIASLLFAAVTLVYFGASDLSAQPASTFVFIDEAPAGSGFSAPEARDPVGGNTATTLGAQRRRVFERAGEIWGRFLYSPVPIRVLVNFEPLGGSTLAAAGPESVERDFPGAPEANTYYVAALANSLAGFDLAPGSADLGVTVNSNAPFYLGLDAAAPPGTSRLLDVVLHELGHGLGFFSLVAPNGAFFNNRPDSFSRRIRDQQLKLDWPQMTAPQRANSSIRDPFLVWSGPSTTRALPFALAEIGQPALLSVPTTGDPSSISFLLAAFGPPFPAAPRQAALVLARDGTEFPGRASTACVSLTNADQLAGNIALIRRGGCFFDQKVLRAQQAGAIAVIIANNAGEELIEMSDSGESSADAIAIPALFVSQSSGDSLENLAVGSTLRLAWTQARAGTSGGLLRLHAPRAFSSGSSVSHWTLDASPNLLMEPFINRNLDRDLDLSLTQMRDIGWRVLDIPLPYLSYAEWAAETLPAEVTARAPLDSANPSGIRNLERYAFGLPITATPASLPTLRSEAGALELRLLRSTRPADLELRYEISEDLITFRTAVAGVDYLKQSVTTLPGAVEEVVLRLLNPTKPRVFVRVRLILK
jgi:hypothetical protein